MGMGSGPLNHKIKDRVTGHESDETEQQTTDHQVLRVTMYCKAYSILYQNRDVNDDELVFGTHKSECSVVEIPHVE